MVSKLKKGFKIFFADAKQSWERAVAFFSALFWTWLEFSFLKFIGVMFLAIAAYAGSNSAEIAINAVKENSGFVNLVLKIFFVLIFILRIPIHYGKKIGGKNNE